MNVRLSAQRANRFLGRTMGPLARTQNATHPLLPRAVPWAGRTTALRAKYTFLKGTISCQTNSVPGRR